MLCLCTIALERHNALVLLACLLTIQHRQTDGQTDGQNQCFAPKEGKEVWGKKDVIVSLMAGPISQDVYRIAIIWNV